ncbi:hypothetical protein ACQ4LE_000307 [Meloidogyne hapla]
MEICSERHRFPFCIVWTPIPVLSWFCPLIGHMGIATSKGVIRDFSGSYSVSEDDMAFGWPTFYKHFSPSNVHGGAEAWDRAIDEATNVYLERVHNLLCDNCHSFVSLALNKMHYGGRTDWNMFKLVFYLNLGGRFVGFGGFLKQYLPTLFFFSLIFLFFLIY